ncbi:hypothetical protein SSX86_025289 [Deinandra increscens subsp. villosa]|uniref:Uncharacterized protein n=1 Tax=Deinandra increscens subsp. villosa TaxID=3103831 RepID=A0AAP0GLW9_9ASTR
MATDLHSDNSSPRISFSYDLSQSDTVPVETLLRSCSSSGADFNFCVQENPDLLHASMADELFFNGKILPTPMKSKPKPEPKPPENKNSRSPPLPETEELNLKQQNWKSFWGFKRSSSCGSGNGRRLCPIALLSRSNSMGSSSISSKQSLSSSKEGVNVKNNQNLQKPSVSQKPPLRKSGYGYGNGSSIGNGNGIRVNPVLNLGFGSFFSSNSKNKSKRMK